MYASSADAESARARAFLGLGSNLGDRAGHLRRAVEGLPDLVALSSLYETEPVGGPEQGPFLNLVAELSTALTPRELLVVARALEEREGRTRELRFGPRTLDVDILIVGDLQVADEDLVVPHLRMWDRLFVLAPLSELAPDLVGEDAINRAGGEVRRLGRLEEY